MSKARSVVYVYSEEEARAETQKYRDAKRKSNREALMWWGAMVIAFFLLVAMVLFYGDLITPTYEFLALVWLSFHLWASVRILDAKNYSRWYALIPIIAFLAALLPSNIVIPDVVVRENSIA
jgi:hypothetical protein